MLFTPSLKKIYSYDQHGQVIREKVKQDEHGREMYREYLKNEDGSIKLEKDVNKPKLNQNSAFAGLMGYHATLQQDEATADLPAYDPVGAG